MLNEMTWEQFCEWQSYFQVAPFGEERADLRMGILAATFFNVNRAPDTKAATPEDFMPKFKVAGKSKAKKLTHSAWQQMKDAFKSALGRKEQ